MERGLRTYILKRVGFAVLMLVGVSIILFTIMRLAPGGPEAVLIGGEFSQEAAAQIRQRLGLDRPIALQYLGWAGAAVRGDLGRSFKTGDPVAALILDRLGPTLQLTAGALTLALVVAVPLGVLAAVRRGTIWDTLGSAVALFGVSFPSFWLGIMLILLFSEVLHLLPPSGLSEYGREAELSARVRHAILPTLTLGLIQMASFMRFTRSSLLEVLRQDYVRTARAKGLGGASAGAGAAELLRAVALESPAAAERCALARDRRLRPRRPEPRDLGQPRVARDRAPRHHALARGRDRRRKRRGLFRRSRRHGDHARRRRLSFCSGAVPDPHRRRALRREPHQYRAGHRARHLGAGRAHRA